MIDMEPTTTEATAPTVSSYGQLQYTTESVRVSQLMDNLDDWHNYPNWQRNEVWKPYKRQKFINTLLKRGYVSALVAYPFIGEDGQIIEGKVKVMDGRQRQTTIIDFINGRFKTGVTKTGRPGERYLEPGKYFHQLSAEAQRRIKSFVLHYDILQETDEQRLMDTYVDIQNLTPLTSAEIMFAAASNAKDAALILAEHRYFKEIYAGDDNRMESFKMALYPLTIELYGRLCDLDGGKLNGVSNGKKDELVTVKLVDDIMFNLEMLCHLFKDTRITAQAAIIVHYEALYLLNLAGYDLAASAEGCLTSWFESLELNNPVHRGGRWSYLSQIPKYSYQCTFWATRLAELAQSKGLVCSTGGGDCWANIDRLSSWLRNRHYCPRCQETVTNVDDIKNHAFRPEDRPAGCIV